MGKKHKKKDVYTMAKNLNAEQILAEHNDIKNRFGEYDDDISIGGMYARKKKSTKSKSKRKTKKKKDCGCSE